MIYPTRLEMIRALPPRSVGVEVGVQRGDFSSQILTTHVLHLHLVDAWNAAYGDPKDPACLDEGGQESNYVHVVNRFAGDSRITVHRMSSVEALSKNVTGDVDWVYIDADHRYASVLVDLAFWGHKIKHGGCIMGHDYVDNAKAELMGFGVKSAVEDFCKSFGWRVSAVTQDEWPSFKLERT